MSEAEPIYHVNYSGHIPANTTCSIIPLSAYVSVSFAPKEKHDGWLDESQLVRIWHREEFNDVMIGKPSMSIFLEPSEALSLLDWLTQEKTTLEQLAKEAE